MIGRSSRITSCGMTSEERSKKPVADNERTNLELGRLSDEVLMSRFQGGDEPSFDEIHRRYFRRLVVFFLYCCFDIRLEAAQDLASFTLLKLVQRKSSYETGRPFEPWLFRTTNLQSKAARTASISASLTHR
jgi:hypothetical protein